MKSANVRSEAGCAHPVKQVTMSGTINRERLPLIPIS